MLMQVRVRKVNKDGVVRLETGGEIKEVLINEDMLNPNSETIALCFRGRDSSGIIDLSPAEFEKAYETVRGKMHLVKGFKVLKGQGI